MSLIIWTLMLIFDTVCEWNKINSSWIYHFPMTFLSLYCGSNMAGHLLWPNGWEIDPGRKSILLICFAQKLIWSHFMYFMHSYEAFQNFSCVKHWIWRFNICYALLLQRTELWKYLELLAFILQPSQVCIFNKVKFCHG